MDTMQEIREKCESCNKCPLWETRTNVVFGVGNEDAEVVFIGEGPGENEDLQGEPFVGRAGKLLDDMLSIIGLSRSENIYIANMVKCRPPKNRDPEKDEKAACIGYLHSQLQCIAPKIIVCLGRIAATAFIGDDFKISRGHGKWYEWNGIKTMALYHPAALLRDPNRKPETFADLKELQQMIKDECERTLRSEL